MDALAVGFAVALILSVIGGLLVRGGPVGRWLHRRDSRGTVCTVGGALALLALAGGALCFGVLSRTEQPRILALIGLATAVYIAGCLEERRVLPLRFREATLLAACGGAWGLGVSVDSVKLPLSTSFVHLGGWSFALTVLWLAVVAHAFLFAERLPGLTRGLLALVSLTLFLIALLQPQRGSVLAAPMALLLAGTMLGGTIPHLEGPRWSLGTAGSLAMGYLVGVVTVAGALKNTAFLVVGLPVLVLGVPLVNVTYAAARADRAQPGAFTVTSRRDRLHDLLLAEGVAPVRVTYILLAMELYLCLIALLMVRLIEAHFALKLLLLALLGAVGLLFFVSVIRIFSRTAISPEGEGSVRLLDVAITPLTMSQALERIDEFIRSREPHMVVTSDASAIVKAQEDPELHQIINTADLVTPDGIGVIWGARLFNLPVFERVSGVDLVSALSEIGPRRGYRLFLLGAAPGVAEAAAGNLRERYPGLSIVGTHHGYFPAEEEPGVLAEIRDARPDILFVAFGIPKQEKWIRRHLADLRVPVAIGVGGSFDVLSGRLKRAPVWMQKAGLEWLYRALIEPKRFMRLLALPRFVGLTLLCLARERRGKGTVPREVRKAS